MLEFLKNHRVNYIVRCSDVGEGEEFQILDDEYDDWKLTDESIPIEIKESVNKRLKVIFKAFVNLDFDRDEEDEAENITEDLKYLADLLRPYITQNELYKSNFHNWNHLVINSHQCLEKAENENN
jgi:hypothetical protein